MDIHTYTTYMYCCNINYQIITPGKLLKNIYIAIVMVSVLLFTLFVCVHMHVSIHINVHIKMLQVSVKNAVSWWNKYKLYGLPI